MEVDGFVIDLDQPMGEMVDAPGNDSAMRMK
jgi:hypothetical protein